MHDINQILASLSPEKRALFEKKLLKKIAPPNSPRAFEKTNGPRPLSFAQESLWFFDQLEPDRPLYNLPQALRLRGKLDIDALRNAFKTIVARHESLRTNFITVNDQPMQAVADEKLFALHVTDLSVLPEGDRQIEADRLLAEAAKCPFDLASDLMLRAGLFRLSADEHILFLCVHHIAADAWSLGLLNEELTTLYNHFCAGEPLTLPELNFQYSDFSGCQRERFQGEFAARQIAYWKERLAGELPVLELRTDRARPDVPTFRGALHSFKLDSSLPGGLKELSRRENVTVFSTLLATFQILLQRYSRQDDILVGSPFGTRYRSDTEKLIGYFINTVVLRGDLSGNPAFPEFLQQVHGNVLGALTNQDVPLERLVEELKVPRRAGRNPLVQVLFQHLTAPIKLPEFRGLAVQSRPLDTGTAKFDLTLTTYDTPEGLLGEIEFNTDLFDRSTIHRLFGHYQTLLGAIVADPARKIACLPLLTEEERYQLWNGAELPPAKFEFIHALFEQQANRVPDQIAVRCGDDALSYAELDRRANQLAHYLKKLGVGPETLVCLCMERSLEMVLGIFGILKAGGAYVPLDPAYPKDRLAHMLEETNSPVIVTHQKLIEKLPPHCRRNVCLDADWPAIADESTEKPHGDVTQENLAYVIFTSGSTGKPKGVLVTHANLSHSTRARLVYYREPVENYLLISSFAFDSSVAGIFWTLASGGTLTLPREGFHQDPAELIRLIETTQASHFLSLPSLYSLLLEIAKPEQLESLKVVIVAGESCGTELVERHYAWSVPPSRGPVAASKSNEWTTTLYNEYGPTEASVWCTVELCRPGLTEKVTIGKPIPNTQVYILDAQQVPCPVGVPGEIYVGGEGVVRGYLNHPELTAKKFILSPFANGARSGCARLYRTGDLACYLPSGRIDFLGRVDNQVKVRGYRIELEEIESALKQGAVRDAVVTVRDDSVGGKFLVGYLAAPKESAPTPAGLRAQLKSKLPGYMVPSAFVILETLPLTPNGKVDRKALPAPDFNPDAGQFVAPRSDIERKLAQIWSEILNVKRVGIHDNFFELGGHSLHATRVVSRMRNALSFELDLRDFFQAPTIAGISAIVRENAKKFRATLPKLVSLDRKKAAGLMVGLAAHALDIARLSSSTMGL